MSSYPRSLCLLVASCALLFSSGCMTASDHRAQTHPESDRLALGLMQKELRPGLSGADVLQLLGPPNIVTTDDQRREVWTYDKVSSEVTHSASGVGFNPLLLGSGGSLLGGASGGFNQSAGASARTDRTLTVIVKFDENHRVRDFAYRATQF